MPRFSIRACLRTVPGLLFALFLALPPGRSADAPPLNGADRDWQTILEQQSAGPGTRFANKAEALAAARAHLDRQETSLRDFSRDYPADARRYSARIRLASVLIAKSRLLARSELRTEGQKILTDLEGDAATPGSVKADASFARLSQMMQEYAGRMDESARESLSRAVRQFGADYPGDRRNASLLAELATLYDDLPAQKKSILEDAGAQAGDESLRRRINDDLRRLALLGRPVNARLQSAQGGAPIDLSVRRGRATVVLFWASWSAPALRELAHLQTVAAPFSGQPVDFFTVSLDEDRAALAAVVKAANLRWPTHCDGRGWEGDLVRSLGINALPTVWVLDRRGNLLTLNARGQEAESIRRALQ
jgi:thiol-disulfide isomerase/thioredoxin